MPSRAPAFFAAQSEARGCWCRFSTEGHLDLEVTGFTWTQSGEVDSKRTHLLLLGFFLTSWEGEAQLEYDVYQVRTGCSAQPHRAPLSPVPLWGTPRNAI